MIPQILDLLVEPIVRMALAEDLGRAGDLTSQACVPEDARLSVAWTARRPGVLSGLSCARLALHALAPEARFDVLVPDGDPIAPGQVPDGEPIARVHIWETDGPANNARQVRGVYRDS